MKGKQQVWLITALLIGVVFVVGILIGGELQSASSQGVLRILKQSELSAESFLIEQDLFENFEFSCELAEQRLAALSQELWRLGKMLGGPAARKDLGEENYAFLKRKYHLMQINTYVLYRKLENNCGKKFNTILFYFSQYDTVSEAQGKVLDELVEDFDARVFAIEFNYSKELEFLEQYYNITGTPTLIVNFESKLEGLSSKDQITPLLR